MQRKAGMTFEEVAEWLIANGVRKGECLISHLAVNKKGYAPVGIGGRNGEKWRAHRLVYHVLCERVTKEDLVLHTCDIRNCIEPKHLYKGTPAQNTNDMLERNRGANQSKMNYNRRR